MKVITKYNRIDIVKGTAEYGTAKIDEDGWANVTLPMSSMVEYSSGLAPYSADIIAFRWIDTPFVINDFKVLKEVCKKGTQIFTAKDYGFDEVKNWHTSGKVLCFDLYTTSTDKLSANTFTLSLVNEKWKRLNVLISIDAINKTVKCLGKTVGTITSRSDGWCTVYIPLNEVPLNNTAGELSDGTETLSLIYFIPDYINRSFAIDNIKIQNGITDNFGYVITNDIYIENWNSSGKTFSFEFLPVSGNTNNFKFSYSLVDSDWHRLSDYDNIKYVSGTGTCKYGKVTKLKDGWYRYTINLENLKSNFSNYEKAKGTETAELLIFRYIDEEFIVRNISHVNAVN